MKKIVLLAAVAALLTGCSSGTSGNDRPGAGGFRGRGSLPGAEAPEAVSVKAFRAERRPVSTFILSNTTLESIRKVTVYAKVNALVQEIRVEEGDSVRRGQVLARLEDREIRNEYQQAQIALEQARLALQQAEVRSQLSQANFERSKSLFEQRLISQQEYDQAGLTNRTDSLALQVARQQDEAAQARLEAARIQLDYTEIRSSIDGVVTERLIEVGGRVNVNQAVFTVEDFTPLWARIFVPEKDLPQLKIGQTARLRFQAFPEKSFQGKILMVNPTVDAQSGTVKVTLEVAASSGLRPGMFGTAYLATDTRPNAVVIPKRAVLRERDENRVFVIREDGAVEKRDVTLGFAEEDVVEVVSGLSEGEAVVTVGKEGLNDGYAVSVLTWEGASEGQPAPSPAPAPRASGESPDQTAREADTGRRAGPAGERQRNPGAGPRGAVDPERLKLFLQRMLQNPEVKKAYDERAKEDPGFADDPAKLREFMREMREKFGRGRR